MSKVVIHIISLSICWIIYSQSSLFAQNSIKGKVLDDKSAPIANAMVSINGSKSINTQSDGSFIFPNEVSAKPEVVKVSKEGLILKDWFYTSGEIKVIMSQPINVKGRVLSNRSVPVSNINVLLFGVRGLESVKTDLDGYFSLTVPKNTPINETSKFIVYDPNRLKGTANYEVEIKDGLVYLFVDIPPLPVRLVKVIDITKKSLSNLNVSIDNQNYTSNSLGEVKPAKADNFSKFKVQNYYIQNLRYDEVANLMEITVRSAEIGETEEQKAVTTIDDKKVAVSIAYTSLIDENQAISANIAALEARLNSGENITSEERAQIQKQLKTLQIQLGKNQQALLYVKEEARNAIIQLEGLLSDQKDINDETVEKLEKTEKEAELQNQVAYRNWFILSIIIIALLMIAGLFYINNRQINSKKNELAEKVQEINLKNEMLEESAAIMDVKNKQIKEKNNQLIIKTDELEDKNKHITDSIRYAETIQQSILPDITQMKTLLPEMMVFYKPKDIVSGDFYWFSAKEDTILIAAADCTGHGVPGAFMTMMGSSILNQIVNESSITDPAQILELLNANVQSNLKKQTSQGQTQRDGDGMDISLLKIDLTQHKITFAGAKNPLYLVKNNELMYYKGSNISIGSTLKSKNKKFENRVLDITGDETVYLVSDGFQDQLGGNPEEGMPRRKYMKTKFIKLLTNSNHLPFDEQYQILDSEFEGWRGDNNSQTDDILVIGFKIPSDLLKAKSSINNQKLITRSW